MSVLNQLRKRILKEYHWSIARKEFRNRLQKIRSKKDMIEIPWEYHGAGFYGPFATSQVKDEISELINRVESLNPRVILEVGTYTGLTLYYWSRCAPRLEHLISVDLADGDIRFRRRLFNLFVEDRPETKLDLLLLDSQNPHTLDKVKSLLKGKSVDFLFIDADHRYEGVKADFELYSPLVRTGGLIAFHDIRPKDETQVYRLWREIQAGGANTDEIITDENLCGIGVITVD